MPDEDYYRAQMKESFSHLRETLKEVNSELSQARRSHDRVDQRLQHIEDELGRLRDKVSNLGDRVTTIEAQASGATGASNSAATWLTVALALAGTVISLVVALTQ